ncbi:MAG: hypothetical protein Q6362_008695 [Candidatus Wukongarchaeota archaeon]|nr:hypothetical protein [Candidatus Wukongarchaeota archaeon]MDO8129493.1 hypothetical protein [Candidatus Wukongarchaeota archaeon]
MVLFLKEINSTDEYWEAWTRLPDILLVWLKKAFEWLIVLGQLIGLIMIILGCILMITDFSYRARSYILSGIMLFVICTAPILIL